jgi:hypothetical protein
MHDTIGFIFSISPSAKTFHFLLASCYFVQGNKALPTLANLRRDESCSNKVHHLILLFIFITF